MSKLDVFQWITVTCYSEVSTKRYWQISENVSQTKVQKRFIYAEEKESMEQGETN